VQSFKAMVVTENEDKTFSRTIATRSTNDLPDGDVLIRVRYSSLNYKDALSATGNKGVTRKFPHTPGIDAAGVVAESTGDRFAPGDEVILTGYDLGMNTDGGFAEYIRVPENWIVRRPEPLTLRESMIYGTAGFTAALSVSRLIDQSVSPQAGEILVTGATGGVGSISVAILAQAGYRVVAVSGKPDQKGFLSELGAAEVITREEACDTGPRPLLKGRWAGVVDTVGGDILATALKSTRYGGAVTCCGLVASPQLSTTVFPFILRGVSLMGIESVECPMDRRLQIWQRLAGEWKLGVLERLAQEVSLEHVDPLIDDILQGTLKGRILINVAA
jgi:putative YhdH/YhfP family quinone oxidoreductase